MPVQWVKKKFTDDKGLSSLWSKNKNKSKLTKNTNKTKLKAATTEEKNRKLHGDKVIDDLKKKNKKFQEAKKAGTHRKKPQTRAEKMKAQRKEMKALFDKKNKKK